MTTTSRNYRDVYSKCLKLGKDPTQEGAAARKMARTIKGKKIANKDHRKTRKRNPGYDKGGINGNHETWENLDIIIRDFDFYGYRCVVPIRRLTWGSNNKNMLT